MDLIKVIFIIVALGMAAFYALILYLDRLGRGKQSEQDEEEREGVSITDRNVTSVVYPPGFEFLEVKDESTEPPKNLDEEVQRLVRTFEDQTTEVYRRFHRLLKYSGTVIKIEEESEKTKLQLEDDVGRLADENRNLKEIHKSQEITIRELEETQEHLKKEYEQNTAELAEVRHSVEEEKSKAIQTCAELESRIHKLQEEVDSLTEQNEQLAHGEEQDMEGISTIKAELERLREIEEPYNSQEKNIQSLKEENEVLVQKLEEYRNQCSELEGQIEELQSQQGEEGTSRTEDSVAKTLFRENNELSEQLEQSRNELEKLNAEMEELEEFRDKKDSFRREVEQAVEMETALLEQQVASLREELEESRKKADTSGLQEQIPETSVGSEEVEQLQREIIKRDNEISQLKETIEALKRKTTSVSKEREDEVVFLHEEITKKERDLDTARESSTEFEVRIQRMQTAIEEEKNRYEQLAGKNSELQSRLDNILESEDRLQVELGTLENQLDEKRDTIEELNNRMQEIEEGRHEERKSLEDNIASLERELNRQNIEELDTEKVKEDYDRKITEKEDRIRELEEEVNGFEKERTDWKQEGDFLREKIGSLEKSVKQQQNAETEYEKLQQENEKYADKVLQLNEELILKKQDIEKVNAQIEDVNVNTENLQCELDQMKSMQDDKVSEIEGKIDNKDRELKAYRESLQKKEEESNSLREKLISAEDLIADLKDRTTLLESEVKERTISEKEKISCNRCFKQIVQNDIALKKAQRIEGNMYCKYCLAEMGHDAGILKIEDSLEKIASLLSALRFREEWNEYKEIEISEEFVTLGEEYLSLITQIAAEEEDSYIKDILHKVIDMIQSGEAPESILIDDDLEKTAYLLQKLRNFPGSPDKGKGRDICQQLVVLGPSIEILLQGIINQEKKPAIRNALIRVKTAIKNNQSFDDVS